MATFTNKATLSFNGGSTDSNTVTGTFLEALTVSKAAVSDTYEQGGRETYVISIVNTGSASYTNLTVSDNLGAYIYNGATLYPLEYNDGAVRYYINGVLQAPPQVLSGPVLTFSGISVPAGGNALIIYEADVNDFAPLDSGSTITNAVTVSGGNLGTPISTTEEISVLSAPSLSITKALSPTTVPENGQITYTFVIQNSGNTAAVATDNLTVTDVFDPVLDISLVTLDGVTLTEGTDYTYNAQSGEFSTVPSLITVPAAEYTRAPDGTVVISPSAVTLTVTGTI